MTRALLTITFIAWAGTASAQGLFENETRSYTADQYDLARDIGSIYAHAEFCRKIPIPSFRTALRAAGLMDSDFYKWTKFSIAIRD